MASTSGELIDCLLTNLRRFEKNDKRISQAMAKETKREIVLELTQMLRQSVRNTIERAERIIDDRYGL